MRRIALVAATAVVLTSGSLTAQSLSYSRGQNVSPAYEGWEEDADGTKYFVFGYMNRNWQEELDVPVGPENTFNIGEADQGQPTHFLPRRNRFVFRVPVPKGFSDKDELIWTLATRGKVERAYASLRTDYKMDDVVRASETGALGAGSSSPEIRANKPPVVKVVGDRTLSAKVGVPLTLTSIVSDDGIPKRRESRPPSSTNAAATPNRAGGEGGEQAPPRRNPLMQPPARITVGKNIGLHHAFYVFRGAGHVTFSPAQIKVWEDTRAGANSPWAPIWTPPQMPADGRVATQVTFSEPGTYVIRIQADDGGLIGWDEFTIAVTR
jgi:hypothetical protein